MSLVDMWILIATFCVAVSAVTVLLLRSQKLRLQEKREFENQVRSYQHSARRRGLLAREVAHELKNPITAILCSADTLEILLKDKIEPQYLRCFSYIKEYGDSILKTVNDFIDVSLDEAGQLRSEPKSVILAGVLKTVVGLLDSNAQRKSITLEVDIPENLAACVDPKQLKQIAFNLVHNSIKFTPNGGKVLISCGEMPESPFIWLIVSDNGIGIDSRELQSIFDPYSVRDREIETHPERGVGLGLPLTRRLIELSGGTMQVESSNQKGTTVTVILPRAQRNSVGLEQNSLNFGASPLNGQNVLLVDPHNGSRRTVGDLIEALGGAVRCVASAAEAVEALSAANFSTLLIDDQLAEQSVDQLLVTLKANPRHSATRVIVARDQALSESESQKFNADAELLKPINGNRLLGSLVFTH